MTGQKQRAKIIAEIGVNHDGSLSKAKTLVDFAADAGANAVKFQSFSSSRLASEEAGLANYQGKQVQHRNQQDMLSGLELNGDDFQILFEHCEARGIEFMSTAFDADWLDALVGLGIQTIKWPSGELTNYRFLEHAARTELPILLSTGMATLAEVEAAINVIRKVWRDNSRSFDAADLTVMHCTSLYPAPVSTLNLRAIDTLRRELKVNIGYSDHSAGVLAGPICVAFGATVFEKHITHDRNAYGPDHAASLEVNEFSDYVEGIRWAEEALGDGRKIPDALELDTALAARQSVFTQSGVAKGEILTEAMLSTHRPGDGIPASEFARLIGKRATRDLPSGAKLSWDDVE